MAIDRNAYKSLTESVMNAVEPKEALEEGFDQLDELSKKTLGSYIKKSAADIDYEKTDTNPENEERVEKKVRKRLKGISRAADELVKEESDQLDEILADGIELFGADGLQEILADFAETGEVSEELDYLLSGEYLEEEDESVPEPPKKKSKKG